MSLTSSLRGLASRLWTTTTTPTIPTIRCLSTTPTVLAAPQKGKAAAGSKSSKKGGKRNNQRDTKIVTMLQYMSALSPRRIPPPLRMARNRYLRHWTIHRGWLMFRRKQREERERVWMRQYQSMHAACEALRLTEGPGTRPEGYLYRVAMEKKGVYGLKGVPIEYARAQTDTPAKVAWNHDWKA